MFEMTMFESPIAEKLRRFVDMGTQLGLRSEDRENALNFLSHNEGGECFHIVAAQMYEYEIKVEPGFLKLAGEIMDDMQIDRQEYSFLERLLKRGSYPYRGLE